MSVTARVVGTGTTTVKSVVYDFSGSSYHYNSDYSDPINGIAVTALPAAPVNAPPVAVDDSFTVAQDSGPVPVSVLMNDIDTDGDALTVTSVTQGTNGTVTLLFDGTLFYQPNAGFVGSDSFMYTVSDPSGATDVGLVTVTVEAPQVAVDDAISTGTNQPVTTDLTANDTDPVGTGLSVTAVTQPANGSVVIEADGRVTYTPDAGFAGPDSFTYTVTDGNGETSTATVTVTVDNADPVAAADQAGTQTGVAAADIDVLANDTDPNIPATGQVLTVLAGATASDGASVVVNADNTLTVTPVAGFKGDITVTYTVSDGAGGTDVGTLVVTVDNAAPVAVDDSTTTPHDTSVLVDVLSNDTDLNGDTLTIVGGSLTGPVDSGGNSRGTVVVEAGEVRYTPPTGWAGPVTFTYQVTDGTALDTGTVTIDVLNAAPVAQDDVAGTDSQTAVEVDVLANDSDVNIPLSDQVLTVTAASVTGGSGTVSVTAQGTLLVTPTVGFTGDLTVEYTVSDGAGGTDTAIVTVTVADALPSRSTTWPSPATRRR